MIDLFDCSCGTCEPDCAGYEFPARIVVDEATYRQILDGIENPRPPTQALIDLFKKYGRPEEEQ